MADLDKLEELNLTHDEIKRFTEAMQKPEFKELLFEYAQEISDPENRARYESEIRQMENERGMDVKFVNPEPGYVIKTTINGDRKAFINVCKNQHIGKPSSTKKIGQDGRPGLSWSLPHSFTPLREDVSKTGVKCTVFDFVVNPDTYRMAETNPRFKKMVNDTALEGIKKMFDVDVDHKNLRFPKIKYKGNPTPTVIRNKLPESTEAVSHNPDGLSGKFPYPYDSKTSEERAKKIIEQNEKVQSLRSEKETKDNKPPPENEFTIPKYIIKYQSNLEMQDFTKAPDVRNSTRPQNLIIEVDLPLLQSAATITLDVFEKRLSLVSHKPAKYKLDIGLAYRVDENEGSAKFDKNKNKLIVTLPVLPDENIPRQPFSGEAFENGTNRGEIEDNESDGETNGVGLMSKTEQVKPLIEVISEHESEPAEEYSYASTNGGEQAALTAANDVSHPSANLAHNLVYLLPDFECQQDDTSLLFRFGTKKVRKESLISSVLSHNAISVKMTSVGSGGFPVSYGCCLKFEDDCYIDGNNCRMSFSEKDIVSLLVTKDSRSTGPWKSYSVGVDMSHLEERDLNMKANFTTTESTETSLQTTLSTDCLTKPHVNEVVDRNPVMDSELVKPEISSTETEILVVHKQETPELHGILKQHSTSESSDTSEGASTIHRQTSLTASSSEADDAAESLTGASSPGLKKSVSFSEEVDRAVFIANQSVSQMHALLKKKQKNVRRREKRQQLKEERRNSLGSLDSGDDQPEDHREADTDQTKRNKTMSETVLVASQSGQVESEVGRGHVDGNRGDVPTDRNNIRPNSKGDTENSSSYSEKIDDVPVGERNYGQSVEKEDSHVCKVSEEEGTEDGDSFKILQGDKGNKHFSSDDSTISRLNTSAENGALAEKSPEDVKPGAISLLSDGEKPTLASVNMEIKTNLTVELKNKFVFDLDVD